MISIINSFAAWLYQVGYSETTRHMLPACVGEFLQQQQITDISYIEQQKVKDFYTWLSIRPLKKRSGALSEMMISHYVYALKTFFTWLEITGQTDYNPISGMKFKRPQQNTREPLSPGEIGQLFETATTLKQTALLHLFYSCGLRRSEGEALNIQDLRYKERLLYVRAGKGAKRRVVPMTVRVAKDLETYYLQDRCSLAVRRVKDEAAFVLNRTGGRMSGAGYNDLLKELTGRVGTRQEVTLHHLRHSIATHLLQSGMSLEYVRDFLGHGYLESTQIYAKPTATQLKLL
jgi:integrase/recombinase XerD